MVADEESGGGRSVSSAMLWFGITGMICGAYFIWFAFLRAPLVDPFSKIASAVVNLEELNYELEFEDLQVAGLLRNVKCRKCDFSADAAPQFVVDSADAGFQVTMLRQGNLLHFNFYGEDTGVGGEERIERLLNALRSQFPLNPDAIAVVPGPTIGLRKGGDE